MERLPTYRTGDAELDDLIRTLVERADGTPHADIVYEMIVSAVRLALDHADRLDLKIANAALKEMRYAFHVFAPYRDAHKVAIFGSARTEPDDPLYAQTREFARAIAEQGWMVVTGAGPGIMTAGIEGAGVGNSFGVNIRLPFEAVTSQFIADDPKLINFRYFFTRKLTFVKEAHGFVLLPGGFGTMDETFELLTLVQTGKTEPSPIVLLDIPGGTYWESFWSFIDEELVSRHYIRPVDRALVRVTDDIGVAVEELTSFFSNYHSVRFVGGDLVVRMLRLPDDLEAINEEFADIVVKGRIEAAEPAGDEVRDRDHLELARLRFRFDRTHWSRLRMLINAVNGRTTQP